MIRAVTQWLDHRTGLPQTVRHFFDEEIPASSGWHQVFGSVALFLFLIQGFTGVLLALNYAPTPGDAYSSLRYIVREVTGGALVHALHHWGASMMVVVVVLHLIQVLIWGAYKKPREATWLVGVVLLLITLAFALTGYLLPWDNRAYWGTVVTTQIAASAPGMGDLALRLMGAENGVGVVTFARFFTAHVVLLPPLTLMLVAFHVFLVRRHGVAPAPGDEQKPKQRFFPHQVFKDTAAIFIAFAILFTLAVVAKAPLGRLADPTDLTYVPRPEWYFLFLFQLLKVFEGPLEIFASVVLPGVTVLALCLLPFLDRGPALHAARRTWAIAGVILVGLGWTGLTAAALRSTPADADMTVAGGASEWRELAPEELAGVAYFQEQHCSTCHALGVRAAEKAGPNLGAGGPRRSPEWLMAHFRNPQSMIPGSSMPAVSTDDPHLAALASFLTKLTPANAEKMQEVPPFALRGAALYQQNRCHLCHQVNGAGGTAAPGLNRLAQRRSQSWVESHFANPQKFTPGSTMPPYALKPADNSALSRYLLSLP